ncbi:hypothetical protein OC834_007662 [Tilletia horrida]|nr:hypothetical protein OC834_007662 [Tilletia horrida]
MTAAPPPPPPPPVTGPSSSSAAAAPAAIGTWVNQAGNHTFHLSPTDPISAVAGQVSEAVKWLERLGHEHDAQLAAERTARAAAEAERDAAKTERANLQEDKSRLDRQVSGLTKQLADLKTAVRDRIGDLEVLKNLVGEPTKISRTTSISVITRNGKSKAARLASEVDDAGPSAAADTFALSSAGNVQGPALGAIDTFINYSGNHTLHLSPAHPLSAVAVQVSEAARWPERLGNEHDAQLECGACGT